MVCIPGTPSNKGKSVAAQTKAEQNQPLCRPSCKLDTETMSQKKAPKPSGFGALVRTMRFELTRSPTRPSNVRVCQFRHVRVTGLTGFAIIRKDFCACQVVKKCCWADHIKLFIRGDWLAFLSCCRCSCCGWTYCSFCCGWSCVLFYCLHQSRYGCPCCLHSGCYHSYC